MPGEVTYWCDQCNHSTRQKPGLEIYCSRVTSHKRPEYRRMKTKARRRGDS